MKVTSKKDGEIVHLEAEVSRLFYETTVSCIGNSTCLGLGDRGLCVGGEIIVPFRVEERVGPVLYRIWKSPRSQGQLVYVDKLKAYFGPMPSAWTTGKPAEVSDNEDAEEVEEPVEAEDNRPRRLVRAPVRYGYDD